MDGAGDEYAGAVISHFAVRTRSSRPIRTRIRILLGFRVQMVDLRQVAGGEFDIVVAQEVIHLRIIPNRPGCEHGPFIRVIAKDGRHTDELSSGEEVVGVIWSEIPIDHIAPHENRVSASTAWGRDVGVVFLQGLDIQSAETAQGVGLGVTPDALDERVVLVLRLADCQLRAE